MGLTTVFKKTDLGLIPDDWEVKTIRQLGFDISDGNYSSKYPKGSDFRRNGVPFIRANNIRHMTVVDDDMRFISSELHQELQKGHLKAGDLLITTRGEIGQLALVPETHIGSNINAQIVRINPANTGVDHRFLAYSIASESAQEQLSNLETGSALKQLPVGRLVLLRLAFPNNTEQRAIATALSEVDGLIAGLEKLIAKKHDLKQAAMQQLLTGKTRLPGFSGVWAVKRLGELANVVKGRGLSKGQLVASGVNRCILYGELFTTYERIITYVVSKTNSLEGLPGLRGDVLMPGSTTTNGIDLAVASALLADNVQLGGDINVIRMKLASSYDPIFMAYLLTHTQKFAIADLAQGSTIIHLYGRNLLNLTLRLPVISEQTAISTFLSSMDTEIAVIESRLAKTRELKQGMMQELLTGRTRLV
jgi:type I restriction enzyme S subunit